MVRTSATLRFWLAASHILLALVFRSNPAKRASQRFQRNGNVEHKCGVEFGTTSAGTPVHGAAVLGVPVKATVKEAAVVPPVAIKMELQATAATHTICMV